MIAITFWFNNYFRFSAIAFSVMNLSAFFEFIIVARLRTRTWVQLRRPLPLISPVHHGRPSTPILDLRERSTHVNLPTRPDLEPIGQQPMCNGRSSRRVQKHILILRTSLVNMVYRQRTPMMCVSTISMEGMGGLVSYYHNFLN